MRNWRKRKLFLIVKMIINQFNEERYYKITIYSSQHLFSFTDLDKISCAKNSTKKKCLQSTITWATQLYLRDLYPLIFRTLGTLNSKTDVMIIINELWSPQKILQAPISNLLVFLVDYRLSKLIHQHDILSKDVWQIEFIV